MTAFRICLKQPRGHLAYLAFTNSAYSHLCRKQLPSSGNPAVVLPLFKSTKAESQAWQPASRIHTAVNLPAVCLAIKVWSFRLCCPGRPQNRQPATGSLDHKSPTAALLLSEQPRAHRRAAAAGFLPVFSSHKSSPESHKNLALRLLFNFVFSSTFAVSELQLETSIQ